MIGRNSDAVASRRSSTDLVNGAAEGGINSFSHVKGLATLSHILGRKWTTTIVVALASEPIRHGALCRKLSGISRKVLHDSLTLLIDDGFIEKVIGLDDLDGVSVSYGLTPLGHSLAPVLTEMDAWCGCHLEDLMDVQSRGNAPIRVERSPEQGGHPEVTTVTLK